MRIHHGETERREACAAGHANGKITGMFSCNVINITFSCKTVQILKFHDHVVKIVEPVSDLSRDETE